MMTLNALGNTLSDMYNNAEKGHAVAMIHLFGIKYADEIKQCNEPIKSIAKAAGIPESYVTEISKGVKLSTYVSVINK